MKVLSCDKTSAYSRAGLMRLDFESEFDGARDWALALPSDSSDLWVVCIHGHGSAADQLYTREDIRDCWLPYFLDHGLSILTPNVRGNSWMGPGAAYDLHDLLNEIRSRYGASKFVFTSGSMGGTSNLIYSVLHPEDVDGVVSLGAATDLASHRAWCRASDAHILNEIADAIEAAYGMPGENPDLYKKHSAQQNAASINAPTVIVHGASDELIPVSQTRSLAAAMGNNPNFVYMEIPDGNHDSPIAHINVLEWVLSKIMGDK